MNKYKVTFNINGRKGRFESGKTFNKKSQANKEISKYKKSLKDVKKHNAFERKFNGKGHKGISLKGTYTNMKVVEK